METEELLEAPAGNALLRNFKQLSQSGFTFEGGIKLLPELISLALALSLYTATFIADCVRAGAQGVVKDKKKQLLL